jgi:hypothetical protein
MIGRWNTTLTFDKATFSNKIPFQSLSNKDEVPGFSKLSVIFAPAMGRDVRNVTMRYVQLDSHTREDHPFNIRELINAFYPDIEVLSAPYSFQKAPDWFHSEANKWRITYKVRNSTSGGIVDLFTKKRSINVFAGNVETTEFFSQVTSTCLCRS